MFQISCAGTTAVCRDICSQLACFHVDDDDLALCAAGLEDGEYYGNSICSQEEQNGCTPEGSPSPLAAQGQQQEQAAASASAAASQASANAAAEQQAQSDLSAL
jgi:hypothetical protein